MDSNVRVNIKPSESLHLPDFQIDGFRGIESLTLSALGRVNLLTGKNSVGKTTVLEALELYASKCKARNLYEILQGREEVGIAQTDNRDQEEILDFDSIFYGRQPNQETELSFGPTQVDKKIIVSMASVENLDSRYSESDTLSHFDLDNNDQGNNPLRIESNGSSRFLSSLNSARGRYHSSRYSKIEGDWPPALECHRIGPNIPANIDIARYWDRVALRDEETIAVEALSLALSESVERITMVGDDHRDSYPSLVGRRAVVKLCDQNPVPLKSLGDGAVRLFVTALALSNCKGGILLMDEVENGIHYSIQEEFWKMVLSVANRYDIQVFATTHSIDCVKGFADASANSPVPSNLHRLERKRDSLRAIRYTKDELETATECGFEMR